MVFAELHHCLSGGLLQFIFYMLAIIKLDHQYYTIMFCVRLFIFIFAFAPTTTSFKFNNETDLLSLLAFKSVVQDPLGSLSSWNQSTHFCNWTGIRCGSRLPDRVVGISLRSGGLVGSLSPHVGNLSFLRFIILQNNTFNGPFPQEISLLRRLEFVEFSNNSFTGAIPKNLSRHLICSSAIKSVLDDPLGSLSSWNRTTHFCNWTGIIGEVYANFLKHETTNPDSKKYAKSYVREYGMSCPMSVQGDTYSYGVVLLEMFTNKRPTDLSGDHVNLHCFVSAALQDRVMELVDPHGKIKDCLASVLSIGVSCSKETPRERMATKNVVNELHKIQRLLTRTS